MSILGLDQVLQLANQYQAPAAEETNEGDAGDEGDGGRRSRGRGQLRRGRGRGRLHGRGLRQMNQNRQGEARRAGALSSMKQRQLVRQSLHFNKTGQARTLDHQLPGQDFKRRKSTGKGKWKTWTPEAVLRVGFGHETATCRQLANEVEGASASQARAARFACAAAVCKSQIESCQNVVTESQNQPLQFFIRNLMFDESTFELKVGNDAPNSCSVLCSHAQWTMGAPPSLGHDRLSIRDEHIVRSPQILAPMNSATMWKTLSEHPGGLGPCDVAACRVCTLTTCDAHAANIKLLKHLDTTLGLDHLFLPTLCTQHRNGNVVEQLTQLLGNLSGCFCVSRVLNSRHTVQALRRKTRAALDQHLVVLASEPPGIQAEWAEARSQATDFMKMVAMFDAASKDHSGDGPPHGWR